MKAIGDGDREGQIEDYFKDGEVQLQELKTEHSMKGMKRSNS